MNTVPKISVVLPVYNAERYLREAIDSVLHQTFTDFELIILDDGSKDRSPEIIGSYTDKRIISVRHDNMGLAATLNKGIAMARGEFIARQDNDDVSLTDRFKKQVDYLNSHPKTILVGTSASIIDEKGKNTGRNLDHHEDAVRLKFHLIFNNPFVHSSVMFRKSAFNECGGYRTDPGFFEDHNLWSRMARKGNVGNLPGRLLKYREVHSSMSRTDSDYMQKVINQSVENVRYYCPSLPREKVAECVSYILGTAHYSDYKRALALIREVLDGLCRAFAGRENVPQSRVRVECREQVLNFKRHYYNSVILSRGSAPSAKLLARVRRRLVYMRLKNIR